MEEAENFKKRGNELFQQKKYADALDSYDQAIRLDPNHGPFYVVRSAAKSAMKRFDGALEDAQRAIKLDDNAKAHSRCGTALWGLNRPEEAKAQFRIACILERNNAFAVSQKEAIEAAEVEKGRVKNSRFGLPSPLGGEFAAASTGSVGLLLVMLVTFSSFICVVGAYLHFSFAVPCWKFTISCALLHQILAIYKGGFVYLRSPYVDSSEWTGYQATAFTLLCATLLFSSPNYMMGIILILYSLLTLVSRTPEVLEQAGPLRPMLAAQLHHTDTLLIRLRLYAGSFEAFTFFTCILPSGNLVLPVVYFQYIRYRYKRDIFVRLGFTGIKQGIEKLTRLSFVPPVVDRLFQKLCAGLHAAASN